MGDDRRNEEEVQRNKISDDWDAHNDVIVEYGNFCIKLLVTLNSTAIIASIAFIGTFSRNTNPVYRSEALVEALGSSVRLWALSLTLILLATFFTFICHRWYQPLLEIWHRNSFSDLHGNISKVEKAWLKAYEILTIISIATGVSSLFTFLMSVWKLALAF